MVTGGIIMAFLSASCLFMLHAWINNSSLQEPKLWDWSPRPGCRVEPHCSSSAGEAARSWAYGTITIPITTTSWSCWFNSMGCSMTGDSGYSSLEASSSLFIKPTPSDKVGGQGINPHMWSLNFLSFIVNKTILDKVGDHWWSIHFMCQYCCIFFSVQVFNDPYIICTLHVNFLAMININYS